MKGKSNSRTYAHKLARMCDRAFHLIRTLHAPAYRNPTDAELDAIELRLSALQIQPNDLAVEADEFNKFSIEYRFPGDYHGGVASGVYVEKLFEHFISWKLLDLNNPRGCTYVDIAACSSPWAVLLRGKGIRAFANDQVVNPKYRHLNYYRREDATQSSFKPGSVDRASLQCAYEMFLGDNDIALLRELNRILSPGGKVVICPLYTHVTACFYQTPEYYGQSYGDSGATRYIRRDCWGIPASRKYCPETFKSRVWDNAIQFGLTPTLHVLRNKKQLNKEIYLHFILVLEKRRPHIEVMPAGAARG
jgi:hypothetical protein